jgi:type I restriction enzyme S subunit
MSGLPHGWKVVKFADNFDFKGGSQPPKSQFVFEPREGYVRLLQIRDFEDDSKAVYIRDQKRWPKCSEDDIMIGRYGASVGKVLGGKSGAYNVALVRLIFDSKQVNPNWARYLCKSQHIQEPLKQISRSAQNGFNKDDLAHIDVPFPPPAEQQRIAAQLDILCDHSKNAREELSRVRRLIERYKQAILAAAFRGDLTEDWRDERAKSVKNVLEEVVRARSAYFKHEGRREKPTSATSWRPAIDLPPGWSWVSVDQLAALVQYGTSAKTSDVLSGGVPVLRMGNIVDGNLDYHSLKYLPTTHSEFPELLLKDGDILFNRTNSAELVGKTAVYFDTGHPTSFASYLIRIHVIEYLPELLSAYINSGFGRDWVRSVMNQQVGQANVNGTKLRELGVPLLPMDEQKELWSRIKKAFAAIDHVANESTRATDLLDRLDRATLAKAFRGELASPMKGRPDAADSGSTHKRRSPVETGGITRKRTPTAPYAPPR